MSGHFLSHSNSFSNKMEKDAAGCRAFNRNFIVGDDTNDVLMFKTVAHSAAVANAKPAVLPLASYVCKAEEFEGVKEAIRAICGVEV